MINFDYASHTPADERVLAEFCRVERDFPGNALAAHSAGRAAAAELARATNGIANLLGAKPHEIIFTSSASEANNLAIKGIAKAYRHVGKHILSTCLEHPSVSGALAALQPSGYEIELLRILPNGEIDIEHLRTAIRKDTVLICVSWVDSELGAVQPVSDILELLKAFPHCHLHVDAAQAIGKIPVSAVGPSTFCFSPHKFYGLGGVGVLVKREDVVLEPLIHGGSGTTIYRSGTPTVSLAASAYTALEIALSEMSTRLETVRQLKEHTIDALRRTGINMRINSSCNGSPYILNLSVSGIKGRDFQAALDRSGICVSVKSACSADNSPSRPVMAVSRDKKIAQSSWRISFCQSQSVGKTDRLVLAIQEIYKELLP